MTLKEWRKSKGFTQQEAANKIPGMSRSMYSQIEANWPNVQVQTIMTLTQTLYISVNFAKDGSVTILTDDEADELERNAPDTMTTFTTGNNEGEEV